MEAEIGIFARPNRLPEERKELPLIGLKELNSSDASALLMLGLSKSLLYYTRSDIR